MQIPYRNFSQISKGVIKCARLDWWQVFAPFLKGSQPFYKSLYTLEVPAVFKNSFSNQKE
jgi:hypothetical protein